MLHPSSPPLAVHCPGGTHQHPPRPCPILQRLRNPVDPVSRARSDTVAPRPHAGPVVVRALATPCLAGTGRCTSTGPKTPTSWSCWRATGWTSCSSATTAGSWVRGRRDADGDGDGLPPRPLTTSPCLYPARRVQEDAEIRHFPRQLRGTGVTGGAEKRSPVGGAGPGAPHCPASGTLRPRRVPSVSPHGDEVPPAPSRPYGAASNWDQSPLRGGVSPTPVP